MTTVITDDAATVIDDLGNVVIYPASSEEYAFFLLEDKKRIAAMKTNTMMVAKTLATFENSELYYDPERAAVQIKRDGHVVATFSDWLSNKIKGIVFKGTDENDCDFANNLLSVLHHATGKTVRFICECTHFDEHDVGNRSIHIKTTVDTVRAFFLSQESMHDFSVRDLDSISFNGYGTLTDFDVDLTFKVADDGKTKISDCAISEKKLDSTFKPYVDGFNASFPAWFDLITTCSDCRLTIDDVIRAEDTFLVKLGFLLPNGVKRISKHDRDILSGKLHGMSLMRILYAVAEVPEEEEEEEFLMPF